MLLAQDLRRPGGRAVGRRGGRLHVDFHPDIIRRRASAVNETCPQFTEKLSTIYGELSTSSGSQRRQQSRQSRCGQGSSMDASRHGGWDALRAGPLRRHPIAAWLCWSSQVYRLPTPDEQVVDRIHQVRPEPEGHGSVLLRLLDVMMPVEVRRNGRAVGTDGVLYPVNPYG